MFRKHFNLRRGKKNGRLEVPEPLGSNSRSQSPSASPRNNIVSTESNSYNSTENSTISRRPERGSEPLGLNVVYAPANGHKADIVFIHGLGGTSRLSWSKHKRLELFWPLTFLPLEPDVCLARILTFGYNASIQKAGNAATSVLDFAKALLFDLKYAKDEELAELNMGNVPIIFVAHSMGGLIVKEAYIQGQNDPEYEGIIKAISAIIFLSTPHRGTDLAKTLNRILQSSFITNSKQYITELAANSFTLQKLNEQFRHIAPKLDIVSFYETLPTSVGIRNLRIMVLERDSSVLGYPGETSKPLDADHHGVCKYESTKDPNYITVRNVLKSLVSKAISTNSPKITSLPNRRESQDLKSTLAVRELPDVDFVFFRDQWVPGTSDWILKDEKYATWAHALGSTPRILWLKGGAATGKSILSSFIINNLIDQGISCQYFFIRFGDRSKRAMSTLLCSLAFQLAQSMPEFRRKVLNLAEEGIEFETADSRTIWDRLFKTILFRLEIKDPIYWIVDGLDEADDPKAVLKLLLEITSCTLPLRLLIVSRPILEIAALVQKAQRVCDIWVTSIEGHTEDLNRYVRHELNMAGTAEYQESVIKMILERAQNNFLWVRLATEKLSLCHTKADVDIVLRQLPPGMEALYGRMASAIAPSGSSTDIALAKSILQFVTCSLRVLNVAELLQALQKSSLQILDLQRSITDLCGGFVVIDNSGNVAMIHQTAQEYLTSDNNRSFHIDPQLSHEQLFFSCMNCLMTVGLRAKVNRDEIPEWVDYAAVAWSAHLIATPTYSRDIIAVLHSFLKAHWILTWIQINAAAGRLRTLVQASKDLQKYSEKRRGHEAQERLEHHQIIEEGMLDGWAIDLIKVVGKFGTILIKTPDSIHKIIPPFCPRNSVIYKLFGKKESKNLTVSGLSNTEWDDSLARISMGPGNYASSILVAGRHIAILTSSGIIFMYNSSTFEEKQSIVHGERVYRMEMDGPGTSLASYGYRTTRIWEISTGNCKTKIANMDSRPRPLCMLFPENDHRLLVGTDDKRILSLDLKVQEPEWQLVAQLDEPELEGHFLNSANLMAINKDASLVAVAYRGHPLSAWEIDGPEHIGHCWRTRNEVSRGEVIQASWHPYTAEIIGLYIEGVVFKWRPYEDKALEIATGASRLAMSKDGNIFVTGDVRGMVKVYTTHGFCPLYQMASQDTILGITFGPDSCRFYDVRGSYGNVWEPNALLRLTEQSEKSSDSGESWSPAQRSTVSITWPRKVNPVTALVASPLGRLYCCGTEDGTVQLHAFQKGMLSELHTSRSFMSVEIMCWSNDGRYLSFSDSSKKVVIISFFKEGGDSSSKVEIKTEVPMNIITRGPIQQLLFHPNSNHLLIRTSSNLVSVSLESYKITKNILWNERGFVWATHPKDHKLIVGFGPQSVRTLDWELVEQCSYDFGYTTNDTSLAIYEDAQNFTPERVCPTQEGSYFMVQQFVQVKGRRDSRHLLFQTTTISIDTGDRDQVVMPQVLPKELSLCIAIPLRFLSRNRLIFLSKDNSICSWELPNPQSSFFSTSQPTSDQLQNTKLLFPLPGDWISRDCLALCDVWPVEKSIMLPRNGEIAVVKCASLL